MLLDFIKIINNSYNLSFCEFLLIFMESSNITNKVANPIEKGQARQQHLSHNNNSQYKYKH